jgi:hypothetical protein
VVPSTLNPKTRGTGTWRHFTIRAPLVERDGDRECTMLRKQSLSTLPVLIQKILPLPPGDKRPTKIALICKELLIGFYSGAGFKLVGKSPVVHGLDPWFEMIIEC